MGGWRKYGAPCHRVHGRDVRSWGDRMTEMGERGARERGAQNHGIGIVAATIIAVAVRRGATQASTVPIDPRPIHRRLDIE